jgi:hypothetical protein
LDTLTLGLDILTRGLVGSGQWAVGSWQLDKKKEEGGEIPNHKHQIPNKFQIPSNK